VGGVTRRVRFLPMIWTSPGSKSGRPFYLNHRNRVNAILTHSPTTAHVRGIGRRETTAQRDAEARTRSGAKSVRDRSSSAGADREIFAPARFSMVSVRAWDEASGIAQASP
jgi:hypothetical protein